MSNIGTSVEHVESIEEAPVASGYAMNKYMRLVEPDPKLRAFAKSGG